MTTELIGGVTGVDRTAGSGDVGKRPSALARLFRRPSTVISAGFLFLLLFLAITASWIAPHDPTVQDLARTFAPYSGDHLLGTDDLGRDVASRLIYAVRLALLAPLISVGVAVVA